MTREEMLSDLAYARTLAEEGRQAPLIGGSYLVLFGVLLTVCYGAQWAAMAGLLAVPSNFIGLMWIGFGVAAFIGTFALSRRVRALPGGTSISNRVDRAVWQGAVIAIMAVVAGSILRMTVSGDYTAPNAIVASGFGLYGVALYASASLSGQAWLRTFAFIAFGVSAAIWFYLNQPWTYLFAAIGAVAVLIVPGFLMMQREPKTIV